MVANYLKNNQDKKVLLLSTTNLAIDQALNSIHEQLKTINNRVSLRYYDKKKMSYFYSSFLNI